MKDGCSYVKGEERQFSHVTLSFVFDEGIILFAKECVVYLFIGDPVIGKDRVILTAMLKVLRSIQFSPLFIRQGA
jgi:hypothetical protein